MVDRRDFIKTVGAGAAFGVASGLPTGKSWADLANITVDDLKPHIGQKFDVRCPQSGNSMQLTLTEVVTNPAWERTQTGQPIPPEFRRPFSLIFQAIGTQPLGDGCYSISHPDLNTTTLHLSRNGHTNQEYEVCFS